MRTIIAISIAMGGYFDLNPIQYRICMFNEMPEDIFHFGISGDPYLL
jgi:hypothetical protein